MKLKKFKNSGFTLLEILLVIGIIGILTAIVIIAINPGRSLAKFRDLQRKVGITEINKGINQYYIDNNQYPPTITSELTSICPTGDSATSTGFNCGASVDLSMLVPTYLPSIPVDPTGVGYKVGRNSSGRVVITAPLTELEEELVVGIKDLVIVDSCGVSGDATDPDCWSNSSNGLDWGPMGVITGVNSLTDGAGNTAILAGLEGDYPAADYCYGLIEGGYSDWYLPATNQLSAAFGHVAGFRDYPYWTSTEYFSDSSNNAAGVDMFFGNSYSYNKYAYGDIPVRCLR